MPYRVLSGVVGVLLVLGGGVFLMGFLSAMGPGGTVDGSLSPVGPNGVYFMAFTACGLIGWGGGLIGVAREPALGRTVGTFTIVAMILMAFYRFVGWFLGDFAHLGVLPRVEAWIFLAIALGFVWLRPPAPERNAA